MALRLTTLRLPTHPIWPTALVPRILLPRIPAPSRFRAMSSSAAPARKYEWLVVVPDHPGMQQKRIEVRSQHLTNMKPFVESGQWKMGGAVLTEVPADDEPTSLKFAGSTVVVIAESKEEIITMMKNDIYGKTGVWDIENAQMWPFKCAFRNP
ncbi:hypothetical protein QBC33DRAFT_526064 [Phialemonium atrogriseum]|uniref:YCII-related domain-containing protein n=1 Tax=Phialemonium atrogriseum TaxID=1093897 RepID=A0AAJ0C657_9PEZI|nr:uncharacterized protein QBC33DRAFT_526064 [Phialemonium atrogriseum]KAK1770889.1 hypothetical protein QBC33DRAFT_526064 [Phialemonium atrogriseum]